MKFGNFFSVTKESPKESSFGEEYLNKILTNENSQSFFTTVNKKGVVEITNEDVKSLVLDKLYKVLTIRIAKLDPDYQEILATKGDYKSYKHFASTDACINHLKDLTKSSKVSRSCLNDLETIFQAHENLINKSQLFKDAFKYNIAPVEQYYFAAVASIIYSIGYITTSMIDYEKRQGTVSYDLIFKNDSMMEKGLPKNMLQLLNHFNKDIKTGNIERTVKTMKNHPVGAESFSEYVGDMVQTETGILALTAGIIGILTLPAIIRHCIYFFMHSKIKLAEYIENQAYFVELNTRSLKRQDNSDAESIAKEEQYVNKLRDFAARISTDKYKTEKDVDREIKQEDKELVKQSDEELKNANQAAVNSDNFDDSDIII